MAKLMKMLQPLQSEYVDRRFDGTKEEYFKQLELSSTLYIGNLSFYTTDDQIYELFGKVGVVQRVIVGLDRNTKTPCGFCFVIYYTREDALAAVKYLNGTKLDNRQLRVDVDYGFEEGRQYGRGRSGGQVRDEFRTDFDADRGGFGRVVQQQLATQQVAMWQEVQAGAMMGAGLLPGAGGAVFFNQTQRELLGQQQPQHGKEAAAGEEGAAAAAGGVGVNPRMRGREDDDDDTDRHRVKRRRMGVEAEQQQQPEQPQPEAAAAAAAAEVAQGVEDEEDDRRSSDGGDAGDDDGQEQQDEEMQEQQPAGDDGDDD